MLRTPLVWLEHMTSGYNKGDDDGSRSTTPGSKPATPSGGRLEQLMDNESARSADDSQEPRAQTDVQGATGSDAQGTPPYPIGLNPPLPPKQPISTPTSPPHSPRSNGSHSSHGANPKLRSSCGTSMQDVLELRKHPLKSFSDPFDGKHGSEAAAAAVVEGVASSLHCPITKQLMTDPVFTMDGQVTKTLILTLTLTLILTLTLTLTPPSCGRPRRGGGRRGRPCSTGPNQCARCAQTRPGPTGPPGPR